MTLTVETHALEFLQGLRFYLTNGQMAKVVRRNRSDSVSGICHSHDYCNTNMIVYSVFMKYGTNRVEEGGMDCLGSLWYRAWNMAKATAFKTKKSGNVSVQHR